MVTTIARGPYGLYAQSVDVEAGLMYSTMRVHSGAIVTSVNRILENKPGILTTTPTGTRKTHEPVKRLTPTALRTIHADNVNALRA